MNDKGIALTERENNSLGSKSYYEKHILVRFIGVLCMLFAIWQFVFSFMFWGPRIAKFIYLLMLYGFFVGGIGIIGRKQWSRFLVMGLSVMCFAFHAPFFMYLFYVIAGGFPDVKHVYWVDMVELGLLGPLTFFFFLLPRGIGRRFNQQKGGNLSDTE